MEPRRCAARRPGSGQRTPVAQPRCSKIRIKPAEMATWRGFGYVEAAHKLAIAPTGMAALLRAVLSKLTAAGAPA